MLASKRPVMMPCPSCNLWVRRMRVVVVAEDELLIRMAVAESLAEAGFVVLEAEHAEKALAILSLEAHDVHVLFTDVRMPGRWTASP